MDKTVFEANTEVFCPSAREKKKGKAITEIIVD